MTDEDRDPHPAGASRFIGRAITFDHGNPARRFCGVVESARYVGRTSRGQIPDYEIQVRGKSGALLSVSLVEARVSFSDTH